MLGGPNGWMGRHRKCGTARNHRKRTLLVGVILVACLLGFYAYKRWSIEPQTAIVGKAWVIDGDTIEISGTRIRLEGIDARAVSAEIAAWRLFEAEAHPREHFDPLWKLAYMWEHPLHFPLAAWTALTVWGDRLWQELIGILGWQDVLLPTWTYLVLTIILLLVPLQKVNLAGAARARIAVITGVAVLGYIVTVYLIFFLTYTPLNIDHVRGMQGRYFVVALPMAAIFLASITNIDLPRGALATMAITIAFGNYEFQSTVGRPLVSALGWTPIGQCSSAG